MNLDHEQHQQAKQVDMPALGTHGGVLLRRHSSSRVSQQLLQAANVSNLQAQESVEKKRSSLGRSAMLLLAMRISAISSQTPAAMESEVDELVPRDRLPRSVSERCLPSPRLVNTEEFVPAPSPRRVTTSGANGTSSPRQSPRHSPRATTALHSNSSPAPSPRSWKARSLSISGSTALPLDVDLRICYVTDPLGIDERYETFYIERHQATLADRQWFCLAQPSNYDTNNKPVDGGFDRHVHDVNVQQVRKRVHAMLHARALFSPNDPDAPVLSPATPVDTGKFAACKRDSSFVLPAKASKYETIYVLAPV